MSHEAPPLLRHDADSPPRLRAALAAFEDELPSAAQLAAIRSGLQARLDAGEPVRFRLEYSDAPPPLRSAMNDGADELPSAGDLAALRARLASAIASGVAPREGAPRSSAPREGAPRRGSSRRSARRAGLIAFALLGAALAALAAGGAYLWTRGPAKVEPQPKGEPPSGAIHGAPPALAPSLSNDSKALPEIAEPSSVPSAAPPPGANRTRARGAPSDVDELELVQAAQAARENDPARALSLASRHARLFPQGVLAQEREIILIEALVRLGRDGEARSRAARFRQSYPGSAHWPKVVRLLEGAKPAEPPAPSSRETR